MTFASVLPVPWYKEPETIATGFLGGNLGSVEVSIVLVTEAGISVWTTSFLKGMSKAVGEYVVAGSSFAITLVAVFGLGIGDEMMSKPWLFSATGTFH